MSHINLKSKLQASNAAAKRLRPLPDSTKPKTNGINGIVDHHSPDKTFTAIPTHNAKRQKRAHVEDSNAVVGRSDGDVNYANVHDVIEISEDDGPEVEENEPHRPGTDHNAMSDSEQQIGKSSSLRSREEHPSNVPEGAGQIEEGNEGEPSFGDMLQARGEEIIDVEASVSREPRHKKSLSTPRNLTNAAPIALGTVLTQALKTNDVDNLESCLREQNLGTIRATIERLPSQLAAKLLQKLAERMHKRPGRAGSLMVWIQWTVVAHGGYLASQPAATRELRTLYNVVKQRAASLSPLLALKGKLDMLEAQLQLRRNMQVKSDYQDEERVVYREDEDEDSESGAKADQSGMAVPLQPKIKSPFADSGFVDYSDSEDNAFNLPNEAQAEDDDVSSSADDGEGAEDLIDEEAEDTDDDESDELSDAIDYEEEDDDDDVDDEEDEGDSGLEEE